MVFSCGVLFSVVYFVFLVCRVWMVVFFIVLGVLKFGFLVLRIMMG